VEHIPLWLIVVASIPTYLGMGYGVFMKMEKSWGPYPKGIEVAGKIDYSDYQFACVFTIIFFPFMLIFTTAYKITCLAFDIGPAMGTVIVYLLPFLAFSVKDNNV
jgi:hypothetical protein